MAREQTLLFIHIGLFSAQHDSNFLLAFSVVILGSSFGAELFFGRGVLSFVP